MWWREGEQTRRGLWRELDRMRRDMERLAQTAGRPAAPTFPALNVWSNVDGLVVTAEIPGIDPGDIDISIVDNTLTLSGERRRQLPAEGARYHRRERGSGRFSRTLQLPYRVERDGIEATFNHGVLWITLPRAEADRPRKISVNVAS